MNIEITSAGTHKGALVLEIIKVMTTIADAERSHDLQVGMERCVEDGRH